MHQDKRDHKKVCSFFLGLFVSLVKHIPIEVLCRNRLYRLFEGALPVWGLHCCWCQANSHVLVTILLWTGCGGDIINQSTAELSSWTGCWCQASSWGQTRSGSWRKSHVHVKILLWSGCGVDVRNQYPEELSSWNSCWRQAGSRGQACCGSCLAEECPMSSWQFCCGVAVELT